MDTNTPSSNEQTRTGRGGRRAGVAAGLTAGLLGGAIGGFVLGVPGLSSAAGDSASTAPAAIVQQTDETESDPSGPSEDWLAQATEQLRAALQDLVDDGTIDAAQADAVTEHLMADRLERQAERAERRAERQAEREANFEELAATLGLDAESLRSELQAGNSIADIAEANGVDVQVVIDELVADAMARLDEAVANGQLDAEDVADRVAELEQRITDRVNGERPDRADRPGRGGPRGGGFGGFGGGFPGGGQEA